MYKYICLKTLIKILQSILNEYPKKYFYLIKYTFSLKLFVQNNFFLVSFLFCLFFYFIPDGRLITATLKYINIVKLEELNLFSFSRN